MPNYLSPDVLPVLEELRKDWEIMRGEAQFFEDNLDQYGHMIGVTVHPNPEAKIHGIAGWNNLPILLQQERAVEFVRRHRVTPLNGDPTPDELDAFCDGYQRFMASVFPRTTALGEALFDAHPDALTNLILFRLAHGAMIPVHTNFDPFMYRAHLGLIVPEGEIGIRVEGEDRRWEEGRFLVFDSMRPHTVWNFSGKARYVLCVDLFRPDVQRSDVDVVYRALLDHRMRSSKRSMGLSGGRSDLSEADRLRYKSRYEA